MAFPVILINSTAGGASDSAASGAGPATALTGTAASTSSDGLTVTLDGSPDLTGVAVDGSHAIYLADSTSGNRNFGKITAKDNTAKTVTVSNAFGLSLTGKSWAIGGKRASVASASSIKLFDNASAAGDAMPGWVVELGDGHSENILSTAGPGGDGRLLFRRAGDTTGGPITLRGASGFTTRPLLISNTAGIAMYMLNSYCVSRDFEIQNATNHTTSIGAQLNGGASCELYNVKIAHATNKFGKGVVTGGFGAAILKNEVGYAASHGVDLGSGTGGVRLAQNWVHNCTGAGINVPDVTNLSIRKNLVTACAGGGIVLSGMSGTFGRLFTIAGNTVDGCTGAGIDVNAANDSLGESEVVDNLLTNNTTYGLKFSAAGATDVLLAGEGVIVTNNNTYNNALGAYFSATGAYTNSSCPWAFNDPGVNPSYTSGSDWTPTNTALKAASSVTGYV